MEYDNFILRRIPFEARNKDRLAFGFLRCTVKQNAIRTTEQLEKHVMDQIEFYRRWLAQNKASSTMNRLRRETVHKLQYLVKVKELVDSHLK